MTNTTLRLWSIQRRPAWEAALRRGVLRADPRFIDPDFRAAYEWMCGQMVRRLPAGIEGFPVWAWHTPCPDPPDAFLPPGEPGVCLEIVLPAEQVLLSNYDAWHAVLNNTYLHLDDAEREQWNEHFHHACPPYPEDHLPACRARVRTSWERIFLLEELPRTGAYPDTHIQAVTAAVPITGVVRATPFCSR